MRTTAEAIDDLLDRLLTTDSSSRLGSAMRYAVFGQGKRLRPFLVVQSARLFDVDHACALRVGAALEVLHCYSLIHDDLPSMDNDDLRRGQPTVHRKYDEATAILAGDSLLTLAFEILANSATHPDASVRNTLVGSLAKAAGGDGMVGGQMQDILAESQGFGTYAEIASMQAKKTGALFRFACEAGAILGQADATALLMYADYIGLAFQIADDILDVESTSAALGKATQKDSGKGKATFVDLLGLQGAKSEATSLIEKAIAALAPFGSEAAMLAATARFVINRET